MALPVLAGPFRCELIYNHEKQPLIELSIRVSIPSVDLLRALSQVAPPVGVKEHLGIPPEAQLNCFQHLGKAPTAQKCPCGLILLVTRRWGLLFDLLPCFRGCFLCVGLINCAVEVNFCPCFSHSGKLIGC